MNIKFCLSGLAAALLWQATAFSQSIFTPGSLLVSRSVYEGTAGMITSGSTILQNGATATADGAFPEVFNNDIPDANFGITTPVFIDQISTSGSAVNLNSNAADVSGNTLAVPASLVTTSFSSKSELALNLSTDGTAITFMGYDTAANGGGTSGTPINQQDISNSNTPADTASAYSTPTYREVVQLNANGNMTATTTNAYSTNNGRAAILANGQYYTVGNGGSLTYTGAETVTPGSVATSGSAGTSLLGEYVYSGDNDKNGKDNNFRGETISDNILYVSKGSGSKGLDSVYQVGAGTAGAANNVLASGTGNAITVLPGLPGSPQAGSNVTGTFTPFGIFVTGTTMYVADEGLPAPNPSISVTTPTNGYSSYLAEAAADPNAGLEKWTFNGTKWNLDYTLQMGLNLGQQYAVSGLPSNDDPATAGLRNLTAEVNPFNGTVTLFAVTSTLSNLGDVGADSNELVTITDTLADTGTSTAANESFTTLETAPYGQVLRGVAFAPQTAAIPEPGTWALAIGGLGVLASFGRRRR